VPQVGTYVGGAAVPGQVDEGELVVDRQVVRQPAPHEAGLGEPVGQDEAVARSVAVSHRPGVQRSGRHRRCP